jgi:hypothetical protein
LVVDTGEEGAALGGVQPEKENRRMRQFGRTAWQALLAAVLLVGSAAAATKVERLIVKVEGANDEWTPTSLTIREGDLLVALATGSVKIGPVLGQTGPEGRQNGFGALQMKIGTTHVRVIGAQAIVENQAGPVKLRVQDSKHTDNAGAFDVQLIRIPADLLSEPKVAPQDASIVAATRAQVENVIVKVEGANDEWTPTSLSIVHGDLLVSLAGGSVKITEAARATGPNGREDGTGSLQMKVGTASSGTVGSKAIIQNKAGAVKLRILDSHHADNAGSFGVQLIKVPRDLIREPETRGVRYEMNLALARDLIDLVDQNPRDQDAGTNLANACLVLEKAGELPEATECRERLKREYPNAQPSVTSPPGKGRR